MNVSEYKVVACGLYDQYVLWQMRSTELVLTERTTHARHRGKIVDIFTKEGAEYLSFSNGTVYRLDQVNVEPRF